MRACIKELLRTAHHPPSLLLRVERVVEQIVEVEANSEDPRQAHSGQVTRLYLTDDQLVIQGLITPSLRLDVVVGDILDIRRFEVRKAPRTSRAGHILYLAIQDCDLLPRGSLSDNNQNEGGGFLDEASPFGTSPGPSNRKRRYSEMAEANASTPVSALSHRGNPATDFQNIHHRTTQSATQHQTSSQSSDDFETTTPNAAATQQRRRALHQLNGSATPYFDPSTSISTPKHPRPSRFTLTDSSPIRSPPPTQPNPTPAPPPPLNKASLTRLASLPTLPPSTPITLLAIITWTSQSLIRPSSAFPPKRHIKLHDLSISSVFTGVTLASFIDAAHFRPARGTVVLLRGVVVQRCGAGGGQEGELAEVSRNYMLNAYANLPEKLRGRDRESSRGKDVGADGDADGVGGADNEKDGGNEELGWYVDDGDILTRLGLAEDVRKLKEWWEEREARRTGGQSSAADG